MISSIIKAQFRQARQGEKKRIAGAYANSDRYPMSFTSFSLTTVFISSLATLLMACELGHRYGLHFKQTDQISTLEASMLGLLALMISFTFSMSLSRYDARGAGVIAEASAIDTAGRRALLLPRDHAIIAINLLRSFARSQLDLTASLQTDDLITSARKHMAGIENALWTDARRVVEADHTSFVSELYVQSLNTMFNEHQKHVTALQARVPDIVLLGLYAIAVVSLGFTGYVSGNNPRFWRLPIYITAILVASVILLIQDIDRPGAGLPSTGFVSVSQQPMVETAEALGHYLAEAEASNTQP